MIAGWLDRFLNWVAPLPEPSGAEWLTAAEAEHDCWDADELWAARHPSSASPTSEGESTAGGSTTRPPLRVVRPADTDLPPGVGGLRLSDADYIDALVADYRDFITDCFRKRGR